MSQDEKSAYYQALKKAGVTFDRHYREYTTAELKAAYETLPQEGGFPQAEDHSQAEGPAEVPLDAQEPNPVMPDFPDLPAWEEPVMARPPQMPPRPPEAPQRPRDPQEMAGQRLNSKPEYEPIRTDEHGLIWYQEEVRKPAIAQPRARRVLTYMETGTEVQTIESGDYVESFEVAGRGQPRPAEVKITLPSFQVGIYKDPRFPFRIYVYNETRGFDLFEVQNYYGGSELVPDEIKRIYVENVLCYDIRTTVRAIQTEYRQLQLAGKV